MSFADFQKKRGAPVNPGAVVEHAPPPAAAPVSSADADAELASWWKSNATTAPTNTAAQQRRFRDDGDSSDSDDGKPSKAAPPPRPEPPRVAMDPPANVARSKFAAPVAKHNPAALSMDEIEALARKETEEMAARMKAAGLAPHAPSIVTGRGNALDFDDAISGRVGAARAPLDLDNLPQEPNDGLFGPEDEALNPKTGAPPAAADAESPFASRLGAAIDVAVVATNATVVDVPRKWYLVKSKKGAKVRVGVEIDTAFVCDLNKDAELLVDGEGEAAGGKKRFRLIDPCAGWISQAVCKPRPGFKNTQTFQEFMDSQAKRPAPKLW